MKHTQHRAFDFGGVGGRRPVPSEGDGSRGRTRRPALAMVGALVVVAAMLAAAIRVIGTDGSSPGAATPKDVSVVDPTYGHETPNPYDPPNSDHEEHPVNWLGTDARVDLATGVVHRLPRRILELSGKDANYDVSPDGTLIAFEAARGEHWHQLWVSRIDGTHAHRLLDRRTVAMAPSWSPDGTEIVFEGAGEDLFVLDVASRDLLKVFDGGWRRPVWLPSFRPDGQAILFTHTTNRGHRLGLWSVPAAGGASVLVRANAAFGAYSPDGSTIAYHRIAGRGELGDWFPFDFGISLLDTESGERRGLHVRNAGCCHMAPYDWNWTRPVWSPDGSRLAFQRFGTRGGEISVVEFDTREATTVGDGACPTWLNDHTLILEDYGEPEDGVPTPLAPVELGDVDAVVDLRTGGVTPLPEPIIDVAAIEPHYAPSPDGASFAFVGITRSDDYQIFVANLDGTHVRAVTLDASIGASPAWSPDGSEIVYEADGDGGHHLAIVDVKTGRTRPVIRGRERVDEQAWAPAFASDGRTIMFTVRREPESFDADLWTVPASGGRPSLLLTSGAFGAYSPDGTSIAYRRARSMLSTWVRITDADGHNPIHVGGGIWIWRPEWPILAAPAWSPDGTRVAFEGRSLAQVIVADATTGSRYLVGPGERPTWVDDHTLIVEAVP